MLDLNLISLCWMLLTVLCIYVTGFSAPGSDMQVPWSSKPYLSLSAALRFCERSLCIPMLGVACVLYSIQFHKVFTTKIVILNYSVIFFIVFVLVYFMLISNADGCDCTLYDLPPCCKGALLAGECSVQKLDVNFKDKLQLNETCCNPPECSKKMNATMNTKHEVLAGMIFVCILTYMLANVAHNNHNHSKILLVSEILVFAFIYIDRPGNKYKLIFGLAELLAFILFLIFIYVSARAGVDEAPDCA